MRRIGLLLLAVGGTEACGGDAGHPCDSGPPTCDSSLVVKLPDSRTEFVLTVVLDDVTLVATCPSAAGEVVSGDYAITCGTGQVSFRTFLAFPDSLSIQLEQAPPEVYSPHYQKGGDFCGNPCTLGSVQL